MHFSLFFISSFFALTTFVHSAPTTSLDSATLLNNALEAQRLNAQFRDASRTATGSCTNGDTTCVQGAVASCVNGQFDTSKGRCPATQKCFALPSVNSNGTTIACTSEKSAHSLINAAGATGDVTGSGSGSSINPASASSSTLSGATLGIATSMDAITPTSAAPDESVVTVTVTLIASSTTTLPPVTQTLSPEQASSLLSGLLAQGGPATTATSDGLTEPPETVSSTASATTTDIPTATPDSNCPNDEPSQVLSSTVPTSAMNIPSSASESPSATTPVEIAITTGSPTSLGSGGYSGY